MTLNCLRCFFKPNNLPIILLLITLFYITKARKCSNRALGITTHISNGIEDEYTNNILTTFRIAQQNVYLWPSLNEGEKKLIRSAFFQISRRTCIRFNELDYKPWYHAERWSEDKPYVVIRKSKLFSGYSDNKIEGVNQRSLLYLQESSLHNHEANNSRGMIMSYQNELLRPDASSYIQLNKKEALKGQEKMVKFSNEQLQWPFDPESITIPSNAQKNHHLTIYCQTRANGDIGAGQRTGLLTRWDAVKLNSMYCPHQVGYADPRLGPCVLARQRKPTKKY